MPICLLCRFTVEADDIALQSSSGRYTICLTCWNREVGVRSSLPKAQQREVRAVLAGLSNWIPE